MYKLSSLTNTELIDLHDTLMRLGFQLTTLQGALSLPQDECIDLEELLEAIGDEIFNRARDDQEFIPERLEDNDE